MLQNARVIALTTPQLSREIQQGSKNIPTPANITRTSRLGLKSILTYQVSINTLLVYTFHARANVAACVLTKVGKPNKGSGKHKGASHDFRKKTLFKQ